jgi:Transposase DDE domain
VVRFVSGMADTSFETIDQYPALLARLPASLDLTELARETKAFLRPRGVRSAQDLLRLILAWAVGGFSLQRVAAWAGEHGIAHLTDEALVQRLHRSAEFVRAVVNAILNSVAQQPCWPGRVLRVADSSSLSKQASRGTDWRLHGVYDLALGGFTHLELTDSHGGEALDRGTPVAGEIRISDRGFANAQAWQRYLNAGENLADFIVRMRWNTVRLFDQQGRLFDLIDHLSKLPTATEVHDVKVWAQSGKRQRPIPIRLVIWRKPAEVTAAAQKQLRQHASRHQSKLDDRSLIAAGFVILATSLPEAGFPAVEILAVYRLRWQIELAFKRLKSLLKIDKIRTRTEAGTRCWLYGQLTAALLCEDLSQDVLESFPSGAF